ncbi:hypothetical protein IFM89_029208 [Coptis chinensis]|uniref:Cyclin C-terminal domain-containing protein n=1 Tax=Coptis chinensis TaxID=261450 RepID=A0A835IUS9_9MAGN|nr:hypothetical protein IFM89_029208 [Coptis chinensis]
MADFQTSTHRAKWIFTPEELMEKYHVSNQRAMQALLQYGSTRIEVNADGTLTYPETKIDPNKSEKRSKPLSIEDEQLMRVFYEQKIQEVCRAFGFPNKIQGLGFDLIVYAPYRSIEGFIDDIEDLQETAKKEVDRIMLTDAPLLFPPGQLALAALRRSNEVHRVLDFERYLGSIISRQQSMHTSSELIESLDLINSLVLFPVFHF